MAENNSKKPNESPEEPSLGSSLIDKKRSGSDIESQGTDDVKYQNILTQYTEENVMQMGRNYATNYGLDKELFAKAAAIARNPDGFNSMPFLSEEEKAGLYKEATKKWHIAPKLVHVIALGSMAAAVQGMDQSVINGATLYYPTVFGLPDMAEPALIEGLVNGAPYLAASCIACWLSDICNRTVGRKWVIFWTCVVSALTCFWQGFVNTWWHLFIARFFMGFGVGIKSATVPAYAAECTPKTVRGALVMLWQFFTAVGIMFGYVASLAFYYVGDHGIASGLNWRLMLGSAGLPALIVLLQVPFVPESPRWLMGKDRHKDAFESLCQLRHEKVAAARDCFYQYVLLKEEGTFKIPTWKRLCEMFTIRRNRNGAIGAWVVMFMQQFCGINVIAYYSSSIFVQSGFTEIDSLLASWGFGMINFLFAIPAFQTIDKYGRRTLLLITFPLMCIFLLMTMGGFFIDLEDNRSARLGVIITGIYLFTCVYSSGEGPVPYTYSAEAFPLYIRDLGMSFATATCWFFNFILAFTWPKLRDSFTEKGAFGFYAAWNMVGFFLVLWLLPETKGLTLEELDEVFSVSATEHAKWQTTNFINNFKKHILRMPVQPLPPLYAVRRMAVTAQELTEKTSVEHIE